MSLRLRVSGLAGLGLGVASVMLHYVKILIAGVNIIGGM
jgi:hypothetical protein